MFLALFVVPACGPKGPAPIKLNSDTCDFCKMTIVDDRFGAELITTKGRIQKFDDVSCMARQINRNKVDVGSCYVQDFAQPGTLHAVEELHFIQSDSYRSPMGGNLAAFQDENQAGQNAMKLQTVLLTWNEVVGLFE